MVAPTPYTGQNGPHINPFLLSIVPVVRKQNRVSIINPTILKKIIYHII